MPLITPETSSSSRDSVTILTSSQSLPSPSRALGTSHGTLEDKDHFISSTKRETVVILGPFEPQTHDLSSSDSDCSSSSSNSPQVCRLRSPIAVPIPRYEDCFEAPWTYGFDQVGYELSSPDLMLDGSQSSASSELNSPQLWEPDHCRIVKDRLEVAASLLEESALGFHELSPPKSYQLAKRPRLSALSSGRVDIPPRHFQIDDLFFPESNRTKALKDVSYTIPQLRGLSLDENPVIDDQDTCEACYDTTNLRSMKRLTPCHHNVCNRCFSAALGSVSQDHPIASCPKCLIHVTSFAKTDSKIRRAVQAAFEYPPIQKGPIIMRIDNVAWASYPLQAVVGQADWQDLTPEVVQRFLPPDTLSETLMPIHIPLDRYDGRTKDYMYIEVASGEAARKILQKCQNAFMPGGPLTSPRSRAVTITQVPHSELIKELRPESARELQALLALCQASVNAPPPPANHTSSFVAPNGVAHFVKNRHGPFNALMSILSKVKGKTSPSYWDLFYITSGAIAALASHISRISPYPAKSPTDTMVESDKAVLDRLGSIFETTFGVKLEGGRLSPL